MPMLEQQIEQIQLPKQWNDWEITGQLGVGAYGTVYCAQKKEDSSIQSAIKIIRLPFGETELDAVSKEYHHDIASVKQHFTDMANEYKRKIEILRTLQECPHIVAYQDFCVQPMENEIPGWNIFIRMELLTSFSDYCIDHTMTEKDVVSLGIDISKALSACHTCGIIHRDIKPDNILVTADHHYKLGDFGLAKNMWKSMNSMSVKGTYTYMAPEIYTGRKYDNRADIYSLGLVLYRLMNRGRDPFTNMDKQILNCEDREQSLSRRMAGAPLPAPVDASAELSEIILHACAFDRKNRYASIDQMLHDLILLSQNKYKLKRYKQHRKSKKHWHKVIVTVGILASVVLGIGGQANDNMIEQGSCGEDASWIVYKDERLVIQGNGAAEPSEEMSAYRSYVKTIEVEDGITELGEGMFTSFESITKVSLPESVHRMKEGCFIGCYDLEEIRLPAHLTEIEDSCFAFTALEAITIPNGVKRIGKGAFCQSNLIHIDIPDSVTEMESQAFLDCTSLESVVLPDQLTNIADGMFGGCESLKQIIIPNSVQRIGTAAFGSCSSLESIEIPQSVRSIESEAFSSCTSLKQVILSEMTAVAENAFINTAWQ